MLVKGDFDELTTVGEQRYNGIFKVRYIENVY